MLGVIEAEMRALGELSDEEIADMIVLATAVPGPIATNLSFVAGRVLAGWPGALVSVIGTSLAPFLTILFLSSIILRHLGNPWLGSFFLGASAGVVVVVGNSLWKMIRTAVDGFPQAAAFVTTAVLMLGFGVHPFIALGAGALISIAGESLRGSGEGESA